MNNRDSEVYYQLDRNNGKGNLAVYDPSENAFAAGNDAGKIQTLFQPRNGRQYVDDMVDEGDAIPLQ